MKRYLVVQHGKCRSSESNRKIKLFPLPPGVKIIFLTTGGRKMLLNNLQNYLRGDPTHVNNTRRVYNRPGSFFPDLTLGSDYHLMLGHTWRLPVPATSNIANARSRRKVVFTNVHIERLVKRPGVLPGVKRFDLQTLTKRTTLSRLIRRIGPGTYIVASCRPIEKTALRNTANIQNNNSNATNTRYRILRTLDKYGGNLNKLAQEIPNFQQHISLRTLLYRRRRPRGPRTSV